MCSPRGGVLIDIVWILTRNDTFFFERVVWVRIVIIVIIPASVCARQIGVKE